MIVIILVNIVVSACTATCHNQNENSSCISSISNKSPNITRANNGTTKGYDENKATTTNFQDKDIGTSSPSPFAIFKTTNFKTEDLNLEVLESTSTTPVVTQPEDIDKIISIVIPFASIIGTALVLVILYKLARKYNCCITKDCLDQCSAFCESCMTAPYMYQPQCQQQGGVTAGPPSPHKLLMHKAPVVVRREAEARTSRTKRSKNSRSSSSRNKNRTPESLVLQQPLNV